MIHFDITDILKGERELRGHFRKMKIIRKSHEGSFEHVCGIIERPTDKRRECMLENEINKI